MSFICLSEKISLIFLLLLLSFEELQAQLKCFEYEEVLIDDVSGAVEIKCNETARSVELSWNFEITDFVRFYQVEYQCYVSEYNQSDNVIVKDFDNSDVKSTVIYVSGKESQCTISACARIEDRGHKMAWLGRHDCQLNVTIDKKNTSSIPFPSQTYLFSSFSYNVPLIVTSTTQSVEVENTVTVAKNSFLSKNLTNIISAITMFFVLLVFTWFVVMCIYCTCMRRKKARTENLQNIEFLQSIQIVRTDSNLSLKTELACPVLNFVDVSDSQKRPNHLEIVSTCSNKSSPSMMHVHDAEISYITVQDIASIFGSDINDEGSPRDTPSSIDSVQSGYVGQTDSSLNSLINGFFSDP